MGDLTSYFLIVGLVILALTILQWKNPDRFHNFGRFIVVFFVATSFWSLFDRVGTLGESLGAPWLWTLVLIVAGGFSVYWIFTRTRPE